MKFKLLTKFFFIFLVVLASVFAANYADTVVMNKNNFNVQFYNCKTDSTCSNPTLVSQNHVDTNKYTFSYSTDDYYAEYIFKEGYRAKGFIVHKYTGTNAYNFEKRQNCQANINNIAISNANPTQGDIVNVNVNVKSAFQGSDSGTPNYRPNKYRDWFDADTRVTLQVLQGTSIVQELTQNKEIYEKTNANFNFQIDTINLNGVYTIRVTTVVIDSICNQNNDILTVNTQAFNVQLVVNNQPPVALAGSDRTVCLDQNVVLNGSSSYDPDGTIVSYSWNFADGFSSAQAVATHTFTNMGVFPGVLVVTDNDNLIGQDNLVVTVNDCTTNQVPIADAGSDKTGIVDQNFIFDGSSSYDSDGTIVSYFWNFGDSNTGSGAQVNHAYASNGTYAVILTVTDNLGAQDTDSAVVYIGVQPPVYTLDVDVDADPISGDAPLEVEFDSTVTGHGPFTYFWDFDDDTNSTQADPDHEFDEAGTYDVELTVRDDHGNQETEDVTIRVYDESDSDNDNGENDIHKLSINHVSLNSNNFTAGDTIKLDAELKNNGDFSESNVILKMILTEAGVSESSASLQLSPGNTDWESLELKIPEDVTQGLYNLRIELSNSNYIDTEYQVLTIKAKENTEVLLNNTDETKEFNWKFLLEIVFASLLIIVLLLGITLLIREIRRISPK